MKLLEERLRDAKPPLVKLRKDYARYTVSDPSWKSKGVEDFIKACNIDHWLEVIAAKDAAMTFANGLIHGNTQPMMGHQFPFEHLRIIAISSYLSSQWALADSITAACGQILCTSSKAQNEISPPQLVTTFFKKEARNQHVASILANDLFQKYGYQAAISYAIRNLWMHEGAPDFFESPETFHIKPAAWPEIDKKAREYIGVQAIQAQKHQDLRQILVDSSSAIDEALGIIFYTAYQTATQYLLAYTGQD